MGEEAQKEERIRLLRPYQVNMELMRATGNLGGELIFLHCLPAFHDSETAVTAQSGALEVTDDVFEAPFSKVFDEAENRMHTIKALYVSAMADGAAF
jgi:ornithine carbamoyltransferase